MTTRRLQLEGDTLEALRERIRLEHGPAARIIAIDKVTVGGIAGFLARHRYEATLEIDEQDEPAAHGIAALIAEAEEAEGSRGYDVSTSSASFEAVMQSLRAQTSEPAAPPAPTVRMDTAPGAPDAGSRPATDAAPPGPATAPSFADRALPSFAAPLALAAAAEPDVVPLTSPGDLMVFVGIGAGGLDAARASGGLLAAGGRATPRGIRVLDDRRAAYLARADAVAAERPVALGWGLSGALAAEDELHGITALQPDQVWVVVDATRKPDDTARWVGVVERAVGVDAMLVVGEEHTATPDSVALLGVPRGRLPQL